MPGLVVLKVWYPDQHISCTQEFLEVKVLGPAPDLQTRTLWGWGPLPVSASSLGDADAYSSLRATAQTQNLRFRLWTDLSPKLLRHWSDHEQVTSGNLLASVCLAQLIVILINQNNAHSVLKRVTKAYFMFHKFQLFTIIINQSLLTHPEDILLISVIIWFVKLTAQKSILQSSSDTVSAGNQGYINKDKLSPMQRIKRECSALGSEKVWLLYRR